MDNKNVVNVILHVKNVMGANKMSALNAVKISSLKTVSVNFVLINLKIFLYRMENVKKNVEKDTG